MNDTATLFVDGAAYGRRMGRWSRWVSEIFLDWLAALAGLCWLNVGCGNGAFRNILIARYSPAAVSAVGPGGSAQLCAHGWPGGIPRRQRAKHCLLAAFRTRLSPMQ
jgi:hypothetical protein